MTPTYPIQLDLDAIIREKAPRTKIPRFLITWLKRIIHQKELNEVLSYAGDAEGSLFAKKALEYFNIQLNPIGQENMPENGQFIFASNHPLGGLDGIALAAFLGSLFDGKIKVQVNDLLMNVTNLKPIFIPVNKLGSQTKNSIIQTNEAYTSDNQMLVFPAGFCSRRQHGEIKDLNWKKTFINKAVECNRSIIPIYFDELNSNFFYNLSSIRMALGIKANIEMLFLPSEMFKKKNTTFTFYIGKPILPSQFDTSKTPQQWAEQVKQAVYNLKKEF